MSFSIFVSAFKNEDKHYFSIKTLRDAFSPFIVNEDSIKDRLERRHGIWQVVFDPDAGTSEIYFKDNELISGFSVNRPPDAIEFWEIIAQLLRDLPCLLYWPNVKPVGIIGSLDVLPHIPRQYIEKIGIPFVSTDPERIRRYVWENS
jgi:hypothetical protein